MTRLNLGEENRSIYLAWGDLIPDTDPYHCPAMVQPHKPVWFTQHHPGTKAWSVFVAAMTGEPVRRVTEIAVLYDVRYRIEPKSGIQHYRDLKWDEVPIPKRRHKCRTQSCGYMDSMGRCACGAFRSGPFSAWVGRNSRRKSKARP